MIMPAMPQQWQPSHHSRPPSQHRSSGLGGQDNNGGSSKQAGRHDSSNKPHSHTGNPTNRPLSLSRKIACSDDDAGLSQARNTTNSGRPCSGRDKGYSPKSKSSLGWAQPSKVAAFPQAS